MEAQLPFCSACGAPQIRVSQATEQTLAVPETQPSDVPSRPDGTFLPPATGSSTVIGIEGKHFFRDAAPMAALTGMLTLVFPPLGFLLLLPASVIWAISRDRRRRTIALRRGQGARIGARMALLSFGFFLVFFLATTYALRAQYHDFVVARLHEIAAQNPDPQAQQTLQWFATPEGFVVFTAIGLGSFLVIFLIIGLGTGALAIALGKGRNRS
jgi:hypothetical protein